MSTQLHGYPVVEARSEEERRLNPMQVTSQASVNEDGQVAVSITIDGSTQPHPGTTTRANSRAFALEILSKQGDEGEKAAVEWLKEKGWGVDRPKAIVPGNDDTKPAERLADLPTLYRAAAGWVRTLAAERNASNMLAARSVMFMCAKADPQTIIAHPDVLDRYSFVDLQALADDLVSCARFAEKKLADADKPADKPDLPALYREAAQKVRAFAGPHANTNPWAHARDALIACAKADPDTAEGLIIHSDLLHDYNDKQLHVVADDLEKCARLSETAADVASPIKLASWVEAALGHAIWPSSAPAARSYLRSLSEHAMLRLSSDLADRVKRYVEAS